MKMRCNNCCCQFEEEFDVCPKCGYYEGMPPEEPFYLPVGTRLNGRYIIGQNIGCGGFGITYKAWDEVLDIMVCIKEFYYQGAENRDTRTGKVIVCAKNIQDEVEYEKQAFLEEARRMAKFNQDDNIVHVFNHFEENNTAYIVMEYLDGVFVDKFCEEGNEIDPDTGIGIILQICSALKKVHADNIIHRDVSPDNICLCLDGSIKLIDFGAARFSEKSEKSRSVVVKHGYAPPEQYESNCQDSPGMDIYALGATFYYMLTHVTPQRSTDRVGEGNDEVVPPHELNNSIGENLSNAIMKAMAIDQHMRFKVIEEFEQAIRGERKVLPLEEECKKRKRRRFTGISVAICLLIFAAGVLFSNIEKQRQEETLPDATIKICFALSGDEDEDLRRKNTFEDIIADFTESFENVTILCEGIVATDYVEIVGNSISETSEEAAIFQSDLFDISYLRENALDLDYIVQSDLKKNCIGFSGYDSVFQDELQVPLGFTTAAVYCNTLHSELKGDSVSDLEQLIKASQNVEYCIAVDESMREEFVKVFGMDAINHKGVRIVKDMKDFVDGKCGFYFASSAKFLEVQQALPARSKILSLDTDIIPAFYHDVYSINSKMSDSETKVAKRFLSYLLSDNAQDYLYLRNYQDISPLNQSVLNAMGDVYKELDYFYSNTKKYIFDFN